MKKSTIALVFGAGALTVGVVILGLFMASILDLKTTTTTSPEFQEEVEKRSEHIQVVGVLSNPAPDETLVLVPKDPFWGGRLAIAPGAFTRLKECFGGHISKEFVLHGNTMEDRMQGNPRFRIADFKEAEPCPEKPK